MAARRKFTITSNYTEAIRCSITRYTTLDGRRYAWTCGTDDHFNMDYRNAVDAAHGWWEHVRGHHGEEYE